MSEQIENPEIETAEADEQVEPTEPDTTDAEQEQDEQESDTFSREYVAKLRKESAAYRERAKGRDDLARRLHTAMVERTGRLADPTDLEFDEAHLHDEDALEQALDALLDRKPHLASRRPRGSVGQGATNTTVNTDLAGMLRARA